jgi:adenylosuccinate lyase
MRANLDLTNGLIFSGQLLLDLAAAGMLREQAYKIVQTLAMQAWETGGNFRDMVANHPEITKLLSPEQLAHAFNLQRQLGNVDAIFRRVFDRPL